MNAFVCKDNSGSASLTFVVVLGPVGFISDRSAVQMEKIMKSFLFLLYSFKNSVNES